MVTGPVLLLLFFDLLLFLAAAFYFDRSAQKWENLLNLVLRRGCKESRTFLLKSKRKFSLRRDFLLSLAEFARV